MLDPESKQILWAEGSLRDPHDPWAWAMAHRRVHGRPMVHIPALADIARDTHPFIVIQKSAQVGVTELQVNLALWAADTGYAERGHVLFLMPTADQMRDFAQGRFDRAIQDSAYLRGRLQPEPPRRKGADNTRLKRIGDGYIYMRGSEGSGQVASIDTDLLLMDEYDQMGEGILDRARRRLTSSTAGRIIVASTPRYPETGINGLFLQSDQQRYVLPCSRCGYEQALYFEENIDRERMAVVCVNCREPLNVLAPGYWEATAPGNEIRGYHLSRLYSPWLNVPALIEASEHTTWTGIQEFQNSDMGEVFSPPGGGLSMAELDAARAQYSLEDYHGQACVMGVDVGRHQHVVIRELPPPDRRTGKRDPNAPRRLWYAGEVESFELLDGLLDQFRVQHCVVDEQPERHLARQFQERHRRIVWLGHYRQSPGHDRESGRYLINRTEALDEVFEAIRAKQALLPGNARELGGQIRQGWGEYYREIMALQRRLEQDAQGNWTSRYDDRRKADHYAHAEVYCLMAGQIPPRQIARAFSGYVRNAPAQCPLPRGMIQRTGCPVTSAIRSKSRS